MTERGTYIVIEGIDGTGKTELAGCLVPLLLRRGHSVSSFHEIADRYLRGQFTRLVPIDAFSAALCSTVDRALLRPEIELALEQGDVVVQDRSFYSTLAYHSPALGEDAMRELERIERAISIEPDVVLFLSAPVDVALERRNGRRPVDLFEDEPYLTKVRWKFEQMFQPPKWIRIDATAPPEKVLEQAINALMAGGL